MTEALLVAAALLGPPVSGAEGPATLRVTLLGTGNPRPTPERMGPSILVEAGERRLLVDVGRGAAVRLAEKHDPGFVAAIDSVLLTHLHSDHVVGLPDLWLTGWLFGRTRPLVVRGPEGTAAMLAHLERAFAFDVSMRRDRDEKLPAEGIAVDVRDVAPGLVLDADGLRVTAFLVDHGPAAPAYGYRIDYRGRSVAFSGDTRYSESLIRAAKGVDLLVHEVVSPEVEWRRSLIKDPARVQRIIDRHTTPEDAGRVFAAVRPRLAVYSHIVPSPTRPEDLIGPTRKTYDGPLVVGEDLMTFVVGEQVEIEN